MPEALAGGPIYQAKVGVAVCLDGSASSDPEGAPLTHAWDFGDGAAGEAALVDHIYSYDGGFMVTLVVNDGEESSSREIGTKSYAMVVIGPADPPPAATTRTTLRTQEAATATAPCDPLSRHAQGSAACSRSYSSRGGAGVPPCEAIGLPTRRRKSPTTSA